MDTLVGKKMPKAYDNGEFIHSPGARLMRIMAEYMYPEQHFKKAGIESTIIFFGSARNRTEEMYAEQLAALKENLEKSEGTEREEIQKKHDRLIRQREFTDYYNDARDLARLVTEWSMTLPQEKQFAVCSGGGPGIMEAANRGAYDAGGPSIGLNISLPFEQFPNPYITDELNFEFHYFFMRKFWFAYLAKALIIFPGGFGTIDELMELLTLVQTRKVTKPMPILIYGEKFWKKVINFEYLADAGMISEEDLNLFVFVNTPQEAFEILKKQLIEIHHL
jgi:uncharacterized protein (TIGR00730 family)